jgi:hypothetical protein
MNTIMERLAYCKCGECLPCLANVEVQRLNTTIALHKEQSREGARIVELRK